MLFLGFCLFGFWYGLRKEYDEYCDFWRFWFWFDGDFGGNRVWFYYKRIGNDLIVKDFGFFGMC